MYEQVVSDAAPAKHFAIPPYHVEEIGAHGWAGVFNKNGVNCLTFRSKPGAVVASKENCDEICRRWNDVLDEDSQKH